MRKIPEEKVEQEESAWLNLVYVLAVVAAVVLAGLAASRNLLNKLVLWLLSLPRLWGWVICVTAIVLVLAGLMFQRRQSE